MERGVPCPHMRRQTKEEERARLPALQLIDAPQLPDAKPPLRAK
jgi:hypothetical protein